MAWSIHALAPEAREHYLELGRRYTAAQVLEQANKALTGYAMYAAELADDGFGAEDGQHLAELRDALYEQLFACDRTSIVRAVSKQAQVDARRSARQERRSARLLLDIAHVVLRNGGDTESANAVKVALGQTQRLRSPAHLFDHLQALHRVLTLPAVVPVIASRGGERATRRLVEARDALLAATRENAGHPEVRAEAEAREVIEGVLVSLVRSAAEAARLATRRLGLPSIADAFRLTHLAPWRTRRKPAPQEPESPAPEPAAPAPEPTAELTGSPAT
jgi:hypothetical protein